MLGVYVHIPFCISRCPYCSFSSTVGRDSSARRRYLDAVESEMEHRLPGGPDRLRVDTVYVGGGTPSILTGPEIERLLSMVVSAFQLSHEAEVTVEANPSSSDAERFSILRVSGANRLSIGVQSFDDETLRVLGRTHTASEARRAFREARAAGFANIGIDLMFAVPGQTSDTWQDSLEQAICLAPEHVSIYGLSVEEDTGFARACEGDGFRLPDDECYSGMYLQAVDRLVNAGYEQYEISNFSRPGFRSRHNSAYWDLSSEYLGFGAAAHSYVHDRGQLLRECLQPIQESANESRSQGHGQAADEMTVATGQETHLEAGPRHLPWIAGEPRAVSRSWNTFRADDYVQEVETTGIAEAGSEAVTTEEQLEETIMLGLRMVCDGLDANMVSRTFGARAGEMLMDSASALMEASLLELNGEHTLRLTREGLPVADAVSLELIRSVSDATGPSQQRRGARRAHVRP